MDSASSIGAMAGYDPLHYLTDLTATPTPIVSEAGTPAQSAGTPVASGAVSSIVQPASFISFLYDLATNPVSALKGVGLLALLLIFGVLFVVGGAYILVSDKGE